MSQTIETEVEFDVDDYVTLSDIRLEGGDEDLVSIDCNTDGDVTVYIEGYIVSKEDYDRLQTLDLIENNNE